MVTDDLITHDYGEKFGKKGDTIKVILDLDESTLSFVINGNDYGPLYKKDESYGFEFNKENEYRFALSLRKGLKVRLCE